MAYGDDSVNALRSLKRLLGDVLTAVPDLAGGQAMDYDVAFVRDDNMARPLATVRPVGPETQDGSAYVRTIRQDYEVYVYPPGRENEPQFTELEARAVAFRVVHALGSGGFGALAARMPVYDYSAVLVTTAETPNPIPAGYRLPDDAEPYDYLPVSNLNVDPRQDPDEDDLATIVVDLRLSWMRHGDVRRFEGPLLMDVRIAHAADAPS